ncbi:MAG: hypothetical protein IPQ21_22365 [Betaproteobacteria bacterium]|nr:hypothetical protein [Betaproteobacteria bacterium]
MKADQHAGPAHEGVVRIFVLRGGAEQAAYQAARGVHVGTNSTTDSTRSSVDPPATLRQIGQTSSRGHGVGVVNGAARSSPGITASCAAASSLATVAQAACR